MSAECDVCHADLVYNESNKMECPECPLREKVKTLEKKLKIAEKALEFVISNGKVDEGEGIWLGHSGQIKIEKALAAIREKPNE